MWHHPGMVSPARTLWLVPSVWLLACASSGPEPQAQPTSEPEYTPPEIDTADAKSDGPKALPPPKVTGLASATAGQPASRELTQNDCRTMAQKYGSLVRSDEEAKLSPKLTDAQRNVAKTNIDKGADALQGRWEEGCVTNLVGKYASEDALKCAMSAKTLALFDTCLNGPPEK